MNEMLQKMGQNAKDAETVLRNLSTNDKNRTLETVAQALVDHTEEILKANALDMENGKKNQMPEGLLDRLKLTPERIGGMADGLRQLIGLEDPIGEVTGMKKRPNGTFFLFTAYSAPLSRIPGRSADSYPPRHTRRSASVSHRLPSPRADRSGRPP